MGMRNRTVAAVGLGLTLAVGTPSMAGADPKAGRGNFGEPYSLGDCAGISLVHVNDNGPVIHDPDGTRVWIINEVTYSDGTDSETFRLGRGIDDSRLLTCNDSYDQDGTTIYYTARLLPAPERDVR